MIRQICAASVTAMLLWGCATQIPPDVIANADYGSAPPENYEDIIKAEFAQTLIDPTSPIYRFGSPMKGYTKGSSIYGTQQTFGWRVCGTVNSKNRFGGYVGKVPFFVLFRDGHIAKMVVGKITSNEYGINLHNSAINEACARTAGQVTPVEHIERSDR